METSTGQSAPGQAKEKVQQVSHEATEKARGRLTSAVDERSTVAGEQVASTASALRQTSTQLREQGKEAPARAMETVAERVEGASDWLKQSDGEAILHDIERLARERPMAVILGGLALGFSASRLLKASSTQRYRTGVGSDSYGDYSSSYNAGYTGGGRTSGAYTSGGYAGGIPASTGDVGVPDVGLPGALSGSPTSGLTAEGASTSAPTTRTGEGQSFTPPRGA